VPRPTDVGIPFVAVADVVFVEAPASTLAKLELPAGEAARADCSVGEPIVAGVSVSS
jgi:hypothetical protein